MNSPIKPLAGLTKWTCVLQELCIAGAIVSIFTDYYEYRCYSELGPESDPTEEVVASDLVSVFLGMGYLAVMLVATVFFFMWVFRANKNLRQLSRVKMEFTPGWSVGWFFIPVACLWKPYQVVRELWLVSHRTPSGSSRLTGWWWFFWLVSSAMGGVYFRISLLVETAADQAELALVGMGSNVVDAVCIFAGLLVVKRIAEAYEENFVEPCAAMPDGGPVYHPPPLPPPAIQ